MDCGTIPGEVVEMQRTPNTDTTTMSSTTSSSGLVKTITTSVLVITTAESSESDTGGPQISQTSPAAAGNTVVPTELSGNSKSRKTGAIAGGVVGSLSAIALVAGLGLYYRRRQARKPEAIISTTPSFRVLGSNARPRQVEQATKVAPQEPPAFPKVVEIANNTAPTYSIVQAVNPTMAKASVYEPFRYQPQVSCPVDATASADTFDYPRMSQPSLHAPPAQYQSMSSIASEPYEHGFQVYRNVPTSRESSLAPSIYRERSRFTELEAHSADDRSGQSSDKQHWELP